MEGIVCCQAFIIEKVSFLLFCPLNVTHRQPSSWLYPFWGGVSDHRSPPHSSRKPSWASSQLGMLHPLPLLMCFWPLERPVFFLCCCLDSTRHQVLNVSWLGCCTTQSRHPFSHTIILPSVTGVVFHASRYFVQVPSRTENSLNFSLLIAGDE